MDIKNAIALRHSVRSYNTEPISLEILNELRGLVSKINDESGLNIQIVTDEPQAFSGFMAHYGKFSNITNYIALIGAKVSELEELCGYYGEQLVLKAQCLGLNTCWVALTYKKISTAFKIESNEKLVAVITLGYGNTQGIAHKSKSFNAVSKSDEAVPDWFKSGVEAALFAPTAMNQQKFLISLIDKNKVSLKSGIGAYTKVDLGIIRYHFEIGAGKENFEWA